MESTALDVLFRRLFAHRPCTSCARSVLRRTAPRIPATQSRKIHRRIDRSTNSSSWQQRLDHFAEDRMDEYNKVPWVTSDQLRNRRERPSRVKMLMRDFIEDSLYNPYYGYFSKQAVIFTPGQPFDFRSLPSEEEFQNQVGRRYTEFEDLLDEKEYNETRQLWHTPTELFRPYYGEAIARYLVSNYKLQLYPYHDLLIYEMGAGNGTMMINILDYIRAVDPDVYARTQFRVIEVSSNLASMQSEALQRTASSRGHADKVTIINKSIFDWDTYLSSPCFFLALEVWDNFAHDLIRYDVHTDRTLQAHVLIDSQGEFFEFDSPVLDPLAARFLEVREKACSTPDRPYQHPLRKQTLSRFLKQRLPLQYQAHAAEYIPTRLMQFFDVLREYFPAHKLIASDFNYLPEAVDGWCGPVVQTRYKRRMVPVSTPLVYQGYFDILFPTDFGVMEDVYRAMTGKLTRVSSHEEFFRNWAFVEDTRTRNGDNPLLSWYQNASVMITV